APTDRVGGRRRLATGGPDRLSPRRDSHSQPPRSGGRRLRLLPGDPQLLRSDAGQTRKLAAARRSVVRRRFAGTSAALREESMTRSLRIVVADDEQEAREYLQDILTRLGHEVVLAQGGRQLVEL